MLLRAICVVPFALLTGCPFHTQPPEARVHHGPAFGRVVDPIAAVPVTCVSMGHVGKCLPEHERAVATATRMALEFVGYAIVDSELLNAETRRRSTKINNGETTTIERSGPSWADLTTDQQRELLGSIGVHGVLRASIILGPPHGAAQQQTITIEVTLTSLLDDVLSWRSRCSVETGDFNSNARAVDLAARCALEGGSQ